jgi:hypothetical protein
LKNAGGNIFFKFSSFWEIAEITVFWKFSSSLFLYSERTIASTETNDTSEGSSDTQLFGAGKSGGVALSGGLHAHLPQKDIEKKSKFDGGKSGRKK